MDIAQRLAALDRAEECAYASIGTGDIERQMLALDLLTKIDLERSALKSRVDSRSGGTETSVEEHPVETLIEAFKENNPPAPVQEDLNVEELRRQLKAIAVTARRNNAFDVAGLLAAFGVSKLSDIRDDQVAQVLKNAKELMGNAT